MGEREENLSTEMLVLPRGRIIASEAYVVRTDGSWTYVGRFDDIIESARPNSVWFVKWANQAILADLSGKLDRAAVTIPHGTSPVAEIGGLLVIVDKHEEETISIRPADGTIARVDYGLPFLTSSNSAAWLKDGQVISNDFITQETSTLARRSAPSRS